MNYYITSETVEGRIKKEVGIGTIEITVRLLRVSATLLWPVKSVWSRAAEHKQCLNLPMGAIFSDCDEILRGNWKKWFVWRSIWSEHHGPSVTGNASSSHSHADSFNSYHHAWSSQTCPYVGPLLKPPCYHKPSRCRFTYVNRYLHP